MQCVAARIELGGEPCADADLIEDLDYRDMVATALAAIGEELRADQASAKAWGSGRYYTWVVRHDGRPKARHFDLLICHDEGAVLVLLRTAP